LVTVRVSPSRTAARAWSRPGRARLVLSRSKIGAASYLRFFEVSGGARVFVYQAAQDGFSVDPFAAEAGNGDVATVVLAVGDALGDALVRRAVL
jgi:hypothetical protein